MQPEACPRADALVQFAIGGLAEADAVVIEAHLDTCSACRTSTSALVRGEGIAPRFGRYQLQTVLGTGGMGIVYRAWDPELARAVAIKIVRRASDAQHRARLVREAQSLARLSHANVCHVYDVGTEGDEVWLAMELVNGVTLRAWADDRPAREIVRALRDVAIGLAAAHRVGLVHRDVKPENVLVEAGGRAVVTDFGLARIDATAMMNDGTGDALAPGVVTATGAIAGTPAYLAPEQITGGALDARTDQFAWATMAWELLTGMRPFPVEPRARLAAIRDRLARPTSLAPQLGAAIVRALALSPADRFASMTALVDAIDAPPPSRRVPIAVAAVVGIAGIAGFIAWLLAGSRPPPPVVVPVIAADAPVELAVIAPEAVPPITDAAPPIEASVPHDTALRRDAGTAQDLVGQVLLGGKLNVVTRADLAGLLESCTLPADPGRPDPRERNPADWGRITRREIIEAQLGENRVPILMYELEGARGTYRFEGRLAPWPRDAYFDLAVGQLALRCPDTMRGEEEIDIYKMPPAWSPLRHAGTVTPIAHAPRFAGQAPLALQPGQMTNKGLPTDRAILVVTTPRAQVDGRWDMGGWMLDPATMQHADRLAVGRTIWLIVDQPEDVGGHRVLRGVAAMTFAELVD